MSSATREPAARTSASNGATNRRIFMVAGPAECGDCRTATMRAMAIQRRQVLFLVRFAVLAVIFYIPITIPALERVTVAPFTRGLTSVSGAVLRMLGQAVTVQNTV